MRQVYEEVKTPFKYGVVIRGEDHKPVDCPSVFRFDKKWYMIYVCMNKVGYETHLAESDDLLSWKPLGKILSFRQQGWDAWQADGGVALCDPTWGGSCQLQTYDGKYWMSYIGGALQGYETDPLAIGMAWTQTPTAVHEWNRIPENPVLSREQPDVREFEKETLYKSQIIWDKAETLGYRSSCTTTASSAAATNGSGWPFPRTCSTGSGTAASRSSPKAAEFAAIRRSCGWATCG